MSGVWLRNKRVSVVSVADKNVLPGRPVEVSAETFEKLNKKPGIAKLFARLGGKPDDARPEDALDYVAPTGDGLALEANPLGEAPPPKPKTKPAEPPPAALPDVRKMSEADALKMINTSTDEKALRSMVEMPDLSNRLIVAAQARLTKIAPPPPAG